MFKKDLLKDKRILVTGGGTGLGKEMANHYAEHGAELFICGRRENVLKETADEIIDKYKEQVLSFLEELQFRVIKILKADGKNISYGHDYYLSNF